jgi:hypothetical protein
MCSVFLSSVCFDVTDLLPCFCLHPEDTARTFPGNTKNLNLSLNKSKKETSQKETNQKETSQKETNQKSDRPGLRDCRGPGRSGRG